MYSCAVFVYLYLPRFRLRFWWRWAEAWPSATICTMAMYAIWGICASFSGRLVKPIFVLATSWIPFWTSNLWSRTASRWRSCQDVHHEVLPSDPTLQHGRIPILFRSCQVRFGITKTIAEKYRFHSMRLEQSGKWKVKERYVIVDLFWQRRKGDISVWYFEGKLYLSFTQTVLFTI